MNLIELKNLSLGYDNHIVLKDINMVISQFSVNYIIF